MREFAEELVKNNPSEKLSWYVDKFFVKYAVNDLLHWDDAGILFDVLEEVGIL